MKDLKHLLYFENLLQEAHNDLIAQAQNEGKICVAYACENTPEPLLNLPGAFSTRLRACLLYTSPSPRDSTSSRMPSSA